MAVAHMAHELAFRGWRIFIATNSPANDGGIHAFNSDSAEIGLRQKFNTTDDFLDWCQQLSPDAIVVHSWLDWPPSVMIPFARLHHIPIFLMGHGFGDHLMQWRLAPPLFGLARWIRSLAKIPLMLTQIKALDGLVVLGKQPSFVKGFDHWLAKRCGVGHVHVISNAVPPLPPSNFDFRRAYGIGDKLMVLCVAGYCDRKRQLLVLAGMRKARQKQACLVFIGPERNDYAIRLEHAAATSGVEAMVLIGLERQVIESAIRECDIAILGSRSEMQPIFLLESMSESKPWICTDVGCVRDLQGGIICHSNARSLAAALGKLSEATLRKKLGDAGNAHWRAEHLPEVVYSKWQELLSSAVAK